MTAAEMEMKGLLEKALGRAVVSELELRLVKDSANHAWDLSKSRVQQTDGELARFHRCLEKGLDFVTQGRLG